MYYAEGDSPIVSGSNGNCGNGFGFGGDWVWAFLIFALLGWGNNGFGNRGGYGMNGGIAENYALATDFATIERKLDGVNNGICSLGYDLQGALNTGFAGVQQTLCQGFSGINTALVTQGYESRLATQGLSSQIADCCCGIKSGLADLKYTMATENCATRQAIADSTNAVIGWLTNEKICALQTENAGLKAQISNDAQSRYIINELSPCPKPAYITCDPRVPYNYYGAYYSNNGCGCGSNAVIQ